MGSSSMWMSLLLPALLAAAMSAEALTILPECPSKCGDVDIPYPFGIGNGCFRKGFEISCFNDSLPFMAGTNHDIEVLSLFLPPYSVARVMLPVASQCFDSNGDISSETSSSGVNPDGMYRISGDLNQLVVLGCSTFGKINSGVKGRSYTGCVAYANDSSDPQDGECMGFGCCTVGVPRGLTDDVIEFDSGPTSTFCPCGYAFIVDKGQYNFTKADLFNVSLTSMPLSLDWAIRDNGSLPWTCTAAASAPGYACKSVHSKCVNSTNGPGYTCNCTKGYEGNAYVDNGCTDIDECGRPNEYFCGGICMNSEGDYRCRCHLGYYSNDPRMEPCDPAIPLEAQITIGVVAGILLITVTSWIMIIRTGRRHKDELYRKNGGPTLENASIIKLFRKEDLTPILKPSNIIGKGVFGEVYKGLLDGVWVAVKKSISGNQRETNQFTNEVIIQSKVIHKNIVRLIGCCLEVDTPMLVYELISQGSLDDILHGREKKPIGLDARINIATASAQGLAYMHSQANTVILHGDVKPANILLDDNFMPKISDFGISRLIARDNEHAASIIGDRTYMDPVYMQSGLLTAKSDVYSFGVVILELISRKKATHRDNSALVNSFLENHKKGKKSTELFDTEIAEGAEDLLQSLTELAMKCLDLEVDHRPTMTEVAEQLVALIRSRQV